MHELAEVCENHLRKRGRPFDIGVYAWVQELVWHAGLRAQKQYTQ
jgi:hypothetical protein